MSRYNPDFSFPVAFPPQGMANVLSAWLSKKGAKQMHAAGKPTSSLPVIFEYF